MQIRIWLTKCNFLLVKDILIAEKIWCLRIGPNPVLPCCREEFWAGPIRRRCRQSCHRAGWYLTGFQLSGTKQHILYTWTDCIQINAINTTLRLALSLSQSCFHFWDPGVLFFCRSTNTCWSISVLTFVRPDQTGWFFEFLTIKLEPYFVWYPEKVTFFETFLSFEAINVTRIWLPPLVIRFEPYCFCAYNIKSWFS